jgi:hypothetical protein
MVFGSPGVVPNDHDDPSVRRSRGHVEHAVLGHLTFEFREALARPDEFHFNHEAQFGDGEIRARLLVSDAGQILLVTDVWEARRQHRIEEGLDVVLVVDVPNR